MVAQHVVIEHERTRTNESTGRIVLSPRDAQSLIEAMERPATINPQTVERLQKDARFRSRHGGESVR